MTVSQSESAEEEEAEAAAAARGAKSAYVFLSHSPRNVKLCMLFV
jgi:hypothetical protein